MSVKAIPMEDWLRGCVFHDGRHGNVTLPCDKVLEIADYIQTSRISGTDGCIDIHAPTENTNAPTNAPTDLISKAKVLETYSELYWFDIDCGVVSKAEVDKIYERLQSLPSADRPTGEWICMGDVGVTECNQCGWSIEEYVGDYKFCPNCGAKMGGDDE